MGQGVHVMNKTRGSPPPKKLLGGSSEKNMRGRGTIWSGGGGGLKMGDGASEKETYMRGVSKSFHSLPSGSKMYDIWSSSVYCNQR